MYGPGLFPMWDWGRVRGFLHLQISKNRKSQSSISKKINSHLLHGFSLHVSKNKKMPSPIFINKKCPFHNSKNKIFPSLRIRKSHLPSHRFKKVPTSNLSGANPLLWTLCFGKWSRHWTSRIPILHLCVYIFCIIFMTMVIPWY